MDYPKTVDLGVGWVPHLVIPECPYPLLGRDLLSKMRAQIHFTEETPFTDGSSFLQNGHRYAEAAGTTAHTVIWVEALPTGTSAQKAELIALTRALQLGKDKRINVYTDSRYALPPCTSMG